MLEKNKLSSKFHPSVFIIGAQKSGTTSIYQWLKQDDRLEFPKIKETHYFTSNYQNGLSWYLSLYKKNFSDSIRCEVDPSYIFYNIAIERILNLNKNAKFIIILRSPLQRAYSHYLMSVYRGYEKFSFPESILLEKNRLLQDAHSYDNFSYLKRGEYANQLKILLSKTESCLFLKFDDLYLNSNKILSLKKIYNFLGLSFVNNIDLGLSANNAKEYKSKVFTNILYSDNLIRFIFRKIVPSTICRFKIKSFLDRLNSQKLSNTKLTYNEILKLIPVEYINWHNAEVEKSSKITKLNLTDWII